MKHSPRASVVRTGRTMTSKTMTLSLTEEQFDFLADLVERKLIDEIHYGTNPISRTFAAVHDLFYAGNESFAAEVRRREARAAAGLDRELAAVRRDQDLTLRGDAMQKVLNTKRYWQRWGQRVKDEI